MEEEAISKNSVYFMDVEVDHSCNRKLLCSFSREERSQELLAFHEAPSFLKHNPFVHRGYRANLPFSGCIKSLFSWSNETINIWSHLLGFLWFFSLMILDNLVMLPDVNGSVTDHVIISLGLVCFQFCMLCSTGYHVFNCHSEQASRRWLMVDIAGVCLGLIGCYLPAVHFAFYCSTVWRDIYLLVVSGLCMAVVFVQLNPRFLSRNPNQHWPCRVVLFIALVGYGVVPVCHWTHLNGGWDTELVQLFVPKVIVMYVIGAFAFVFYMTRMPECCLPGRVDYIGSSHQWWHLLVVFAFTYWHNAGYQFLKYRTQSHCNGDGT